MTDWPTTSPFSPDGLPYCPACQGARWDYQPPLPGQLTGTLVPCATCAPWVARHRRIVRYRRLEARVQTYSQQTGRYRRQTFDTFVLPRDAPSVQEAYRAAQRFAVQPQGWLVLYGAKGTGKSHLAAAIANHQLTRPEEERLLTLFFTVPALLDLLRHGYQTGDYREVLDLCLTCDLLLLDDLGAEQETPWATEKLFLILNHRYQAELLTVIVTNCRLEALDPRLYDRLSEDGFAVRVAVLAPSYRQRRSQPGVIVQ